MAEAPERRSARINLRVEPADDDLLRRAARLEHKSLSAFLLDAARERAQRTVESQQRIRVSTAEFERLMDELEQPPRVLPGLLASIQRLDDR